MSSGRDNKHVNRNFPVLAELEYFQHLRCKTVLEYVRRKG